MINKSVKEKLIKIKNALQDSPEHDLAEGFKSTKKECNNDDCFDIRKEYRNGRISCRLKTFGCIACISLSSNFLLRLYTEGRKINEQFCVTHYKLLWSSILGLGIISFIINKENENNILNKTPYVLDDFRIAQGLPTIYGRNKSLVKRQKLAVNQMERLNKDKNIIL